jgi:hypothetical protein
MKPGGAHRDFNFHKANHGSLSDNEYAIFQAKLAANPGLGALIKNGGGIRKIRVAIGREGSAAEPGSSTTGRRIEI